MEKRRKKKVNQKNYESRKNTKEKLITIKYIPKKKIKQNKYFKTHLLHFSRYSE